MSAAKKPQDHKKKAVDRLRDEAEERSTLDDLLGREITVEGRAETITVTVLEDPMDWDADVAEILAGWQKAGGIIVAEVIPLLRRIVSLEDGRRLDLARPTQRAVRALIAELTGNAADGDEADRGPIDDLGESQAS